MKPFNQRGEPATGWLEKRNEKVGSGETGTWPSWRTAKLG